MMTGNEARAMGILTALAEIAVEHMEMEGYEQEFYATAHRIEFFKDKMKEVKELLEDK